MPHALFSACDCQSDGFFCFQNVSLFVFSLSGTFENSQVLSKVLTWDVLYLLCRTPGEITVIWRFYILCRVMVWGCSCLFDELSKSERNCRHRVEFLKSRSLVPKETHISYIKLVFWNSPSSLYSSISVSYGSNSFVCMRRSQFVCGTHYTQVRHSLRFFTTRYCDDPQMNGWPLSIPSVRYRSVNRFRLHVCSPVEIVWSRHKLYVRTYMNPSKNKRVWTNQC